MKQQFTLLLRDSQPADKPDMVDDVLDGGLKESYELGVDHCIRLVEQRYGYLLASKFGSQNPTVWAAVSVELFELITKLQNLKKP